MSKKKQLKVESRLPEVKQSNVATAALLNEEEIKSSMLLNIVPNKMAHWIAVSFIAILSVAMYWNTKSNGFVLDDHGIIKSNKITKNGLSAENIKQIFTTSHRKGDVSDLEHSLYRPVAKLIFAAEYKWGNGDAGYMHVWNVFYFMLCSVLLYWLCYLATKKNWVLSLAITMVFAVHPIHVESVANIKSLDEVLGAIGVFGALICFHYYVESKKWWLLLIALISYALGIFSKESAIVAVALAPLYLYYFTNAKLKDYIYCTAVMVIGAVMFLYMREVAIGFFLHSEAGKKEPSALDNVLALTKIDQTKLGGYQMSKFLPTVVYLMGYYVYTLFVPFPLSCDYSYGTVDVKGLGDWEFLVSIAMFLGLLFFTYKTIKQKNIIGFGILWFLIASSIISNVFIVIGTSFGERLMFLPSVGWAIAAVGAVYQIFKYAKNVEAPSLNFVNGILQHKVLFAIIAIVGAIYGAKTIDRNMDWKTDYDLFSTDVKKFSTETDPYTKSTHLLFYWGNHVSSSEYHERLKALGEAASKSKETIAAEIAQANKDAIATFRKSMGIYPALPADGYNQYGKAFYNQGNYDSAQFYYYKAHKEDSTNSVFINNLGTIFFQRATPLNRVDYFDSARKYFSLAYQRDTTVIDYMNNMGAISGTQQRLPEALTWFYKAYKSDSLTEGAALSCNSLAVTYRTMGDSNNMRLWQNQAQAILKYRMQKLQNGGF